MTDTAEERGGGGAARRGAAAQGPGPAEDPARIAAAMWAGDAASRWLGMALGPVTEGAATLTLTVAPHHLNGHGTCHGGVIFALADSAFAFACNSRGAATVAMHCLVTFLAPAREGDALTAIARETHLEGRNGVYDVEVTGSSGPIAQFRGMSRALARPAARPDPPETPR
jgi:acyl-CoA thioesterase